MIHLPQMLVQQPSASPNTLPNHFFFHSHLPRTLHLRRPSKFRRSFLLRCASATSDTRVLPQSAIQRIAEKLRSLGYVEENEDNKRPSPPEQTLTSSPGEIFIPLPNRLPKHRVGHTLDSPLNRNWSTTENPVPETGSGLRRDVSKEKKEDKVRRVRGRDGEVAPTLAELKLPAKELRRLRTAGIALNERLKIGKAGITEGIIHGIHERWRRSELAKIECHDLCRLNMRRTHDLLERKTGGLVVWRSGSTIALYRGADYKYPYFFVKPNGAPDDSSMSSPGDSEDGGAKQSFSTGTDGAISVPQTEIANPPLIKGVGSRTRVRFQLPGEAQLAEEADQLLQGLGPRFVGWYGYDPLPVDADLLPAVVPGYRKPFRLLPHGVQPTLTGNEMTVLRRLGKPLPCHFALSRHRKLQGLAVAIFKLWEKCEIAKIAIKRGTQDEYGELMAEELKWLTGGSLLERNKEYMLLYRGKDFLPATVSSAIEQRRNHGLLGNESKKVSSPSNALTNKDQGMKYSSSTKLGWTSDLGDGRKLRSSESAIKSASAELSQARMRKESSEKLLEEVEEEEIGEQLEVDKEGITEEERYMLKKVGLKMKPYLLLGRRGVFDGTVENMHLHWKYRELVKILSGEKSTKEAYAIARTLEAESGGILVAVERVTKGHTIIVYRGKNYKRPPSLRPQTLLNKREALKLSIETQRRKSLKLDVLKFSRNDDELKLKSSDEAINRQGENDGKGPLEQEMKESQSAKHMEPETELELSNLVPSLNQENEQAREYHGGDSMSIQGLEVSQRSPETNCQDVSKDFSMRSEGEDSMASGVPKLEIDTSLNNKQTRQQGILKLSSVKHGYKDGRTATETGSKAKSVMAKGTEEVEMENGNNKSKLTESSTRLKNFKVEGLNSSTGIRSTEPAVSIAQNDVPFVDSPIHRPRAKQSTERPYRSSLLSNKERLLLRKQALKMKKRPVLAVGKSNIVTGVAKTIRTHFQKHPLAIVNIKGIAKGTSVQDLILKLEESTGAVFISQEPNKIILYRGWGAVEDPKDPNPAKVDVKGALRTKSEASAKPIISPELISAIRLECGLLHDEEDINVS